MKLASISNEYQLRVAASLSATTFQIVLKRRAWLSVKSFGSLSGCRENFAFLTAVYYHRQMMREVSTTGKRMQNAKTCKIGRAYLASIILCSSRLTSWNASLSNLFHLAKYSCGSTLVFFGGKILGTVTSKCPR